MELRLHRFRHSQHLLSPNPEQTSLRTVRRRCQALVCLAYLRQRLGLGAAGRPCAVQSICAPPPPPPRVGGGIGGYGGCDRYLQEASEPSCAEMPHALLATGEQVKAAATTVQTRRQRKPPCPCLHGRTVVVAAKRLNIQRPDAAMRATTPHP